MKTTRFDELMQKSERCYRTSFLVRGLMRTIWQQKAIELKEIAYSLTVAEAEVEVEL